MQNQADTSQARLPGIDSPLRGSVKNERSIMVYNFFSLSKEPKTRLEPYDDGQVRIEVKGTEAGVATIYDKELIIYIASLMVEKMNAAETVEQEFTFTAHDFFRVVGIRPSDTAYERLSGALERLQGTQVKTNIETGGEGTDEWFSWLEHAKASYTRGANGEKRLRSVSVRLCQWLYRGILKDQRVLTYDPSFFDLPPLEKRLYEMARAHCGEQPGFKMGLEKLRRRVGSEMGPKDFKSRLVRISEKKNPLPEYAFKVIDRKPPGRIRFDPRSAVVVFWRQSRWKEYDEASFPDAD